MNTSMKNNQDIHPEDGKQLRPSFPGSGLPLWLRITLVTIAVLGYASFLIYGALPEASKPTAQYVVDSNFKDVDTVLKSIHYEQYESIFEARDSIKSGTRPPMHLAPLRFQAVVEDPQSFESLGQQLRGLDGYTCIASAENLESGVYRVLKCEDDNLQVSIAGVEDGEVLLTVSDRGRK